MSVSSKCAHGNTLMYVTLYGHHIYSKSKDQPVMVANPARGELKREIEYFPVLVRT